MKRIIDIDINDLLLIEKYQYEYDSILNILAYLLKQKNINLNNLDKYFSQAKEIYIYLQEIKKNIYTKYNINNNIDHNNIIINIEKQQIIIYEE